MNNRIYDNEESNNENTVHMTHEEYMAYKLSCETLLSQAKQAEKLAELPEFKAIIMDAYFDQEPKRLAGLMATGRLNENQFNDCVSDLRSIGSLRTFLQDFIQKGNIASDELKGLEIAWNESVIADATNGGNA